MRVTICDDGVYCTASRETFDRIARMLEEWASVTEAVLGRQRDADTSSASEESKSVSSVMTVSGVMGNTHPSCRDPRTTDLCLHWRYYTLEHGVAAS